MNSIAPIYLLSILNTNEYIYELAVWEKVIHHPELLFTHVTGSQQDFSNLLQNFSESIICTKKTPYNSLAAAKCSFGKHDFKGLIPESMVEKGQM